MEFPVRKTLGENQSLQKKKKAKKTPNHGGISQPLLAITSPAEFPIIPALRILEDFSRKLFPIIRAKNVPFHSWCDSQSSGGFGGALGTQSSFPGMELGKRELLSWEKGNYWAGKAQLPAQSLVAWKRWIWIPKNGNFSAGGAVHSPRSKAGLDSPLSQGDFWLNLVSLSW